MTSALSGNPNAQPITPIGHVSKHMRPFLERNNNLTHPRESDFVN